MRKALLLLICLAFANAEAANHYVREAASGSNDGSSWANAFNAIPTSPIRGDTYYLAGGTYAGVTITTVPSGTSTITLKKANASDNSGDAGWSASYASTQAVIGPIVLFYGYFVFDGVTGSGVTGHGFKISNPNLSGNVIGLNLGDAHTVTVAHTEIAGPGFGSADTGSVCIKTAFFAAPRKNVWIHHCWLHDVTRDGIDALGHVGTSYSDYGLLVEDNVIEKTGGNPDASIHGQGMFAGYSEPSSYLIIRRNIFRNIVGTSMIVFLGNSTVGVFTAATNDVITKAGHGLSANTRVFFTTSGGTLPGGITSGVRYYVRDITTDTFKIAATPGGTAIDLTSTGSGTNICWYTIAEYSEVRIYNNSFSITDNSTYNTISPGVIYVSSLCDSMTNLLIANNAFWGIGPSNANDTIAQVGCEAPTHSGVVFENNISETNYYSSTHFGLDTQANNGYYNNTGAGVPSGTTGQINGASSTFNSAATGDFTLKTGGYGVDAGVDLSSIFTDDISGATRTGAWDLGPYDSSTGGGGGGGSAPTGSPSRKKSKANSGALRSILR